MRNKLQAIYYNLELRVYYDSREFWRNPLKLFKIIDIIKYNMVRSLIVSEAWHSRENLNETNEHSLFINFKKKV
jgi:hypothetical protein